MTYSSSTPRTYKNQASCFAGQTDDQVNARMVRDHFKFSFPNDKYIVSDLPKEIVEYNLANKEDRFGVVIVKEGKSYSAYVNGIGYSEKLLSEGEHISDWTKAYSLENDRPLHSRSVKGALAMAVKAEEYLEYQNNRNNEQSAIHRQDFQIRSINRIDAKGGPEGEGEEAAYNEAHRRVNLDALLLVATIDNDARITKAREERANSSAS